MFDLAASMGKIGFGALSGAARSSLTFYAIARLVDNALGVVSFVSSCCLLIF